MRRLQVGPAILVLFCATSRAAVNASLAPDKTALERARDDTGLEPRTPLWFPEGYHFESLSVVPYHGKKIIHFRFTDGAAVVSLFQCPPRTRFDFGKKGRERVRLAAGRGFFAKSSEGNVLIWSAGKNRLALVAPLELPELKKIADSIPP